jgi:hypothetical protein
MGLTDAAPASAEPSAAEPGRGPKSPPRQRRSATNNTEDRHAASNQEPLPSGGYSRPRVPDGRMREHRQQRDQQLAQPDGDGPGRPWYDAPGHLGAAGHLCGPSQLHGRFDGPAQRGGHDHHRGARHLGACRVRDARHRVRYQPAVVVDPPGRRGRGRADRLDRSLGSPPLGRRRQLAVEAHRRVRERISSARRDERRGNARRRGRRRRGRPVVRRPAACG